MTAQHVENQLDRVYRAGRDVSSPKVIAKTEATYSQEARIAKLEGSVAISLIVGPDGESRDMHVTRPLGFGLDEQALATVRIWRFQPGTKSGRPVAVETTVELFFHVQRDVREWHLEAVDFAVPQGAARPKVVEAKYPAPKGPDEENAAVLVAFDVDERGAPRNISVRKSSDEQWESEVTLMLGKWRFLPATKDGQPLKTAGTLFFVRGSHAPIPPPR